MKCLNNWDVEKVIHKSKILEFDFLFNKDLIYEIEADYYFLNVKLQDAEHALYLEENTKLANELGIECVETEIKKFIKKLNTYNEVKDIMQSLIGKIADYRGVLIRDVHEEFEVLNE